MTLRDLLNELETTTGRLSQEDDRRWHVLAQILRGICEATVDLDHEVSEKP